MELFTASGAKKTTAGVGLDGMGTYQARPAANTVPSGYVYKATNAGTYASDGTNWSMIAPGFFSFSDVTARTLTSTTYAVMPTAPDQISGLYMPPDGKFVLGYNARVQTTVAGTAKASIFIDGNQLQYITFTGGSSPTPLQSVQELVGFWNSTSYMPIWVGPLGIVGIGPTAGAAEMAAEVTTGLLIGGVGNAGTQIGNSGNTGVQYGGSCELFAAAGTHDVSIRFLSSSGNVLRKNARMWVEVWGN